MTTANAGQLLQPAAEPQWVIAPEPGGIFAARARRFQALATEHALDEYLHFMGRLTLAQHRALSAQDATTPNAAIAGIARGVPPVPATIWRRDRSWQTALAGILDALEPEAPGAARAIMRRLRDAGADQLDALADRLLRTEPPDEPATLPFVAAALQVYWTRLAAGFDGRLAPPEDAGTCPCCGSLPVASVVRADGIVANLRYLHCALCNTEWNMVRVKCAACHATGGISYHQIEGSNGVVCAETCDTCKTYLKIVHLDKERQADPVADDMATLALDILMDEAGYVRSGPNLLLMPGNVA